MDEEKIMETQRENSFAMSLYEWLQVLKNHMQSKQTIYPNTRYVPTPSRKTHTVKRQMPVVPRSTPSPQIQLNFA